MLGEELGEERGKIIGTRVLSVDADSHKVETSFQGRGEILGIEYDSNGTYTVYHIPPLPPQGKGQGFLRTKDREVVHWTGQGVGKPTERGGISFRGAMYCQTKSQKLARLNSVAILFENEVDMEKGEYHAKFWEWK